MSFEQAKNTPLRRRVATGLVAGLSIIALSAMPSAAETTEEEEIWHEVDGASFGATADAGPNVWCLADAGSLGLPNPVAACGQEPRRP